MGQEVKKAQSLLELEDVKDKIRVLIAHIPREKELLTLNKKIRFEAHEKMHKPQQDYCSRQQLKAIQKELDEAGEMTLRGLAFLEGKELLGGHGSGGCLKSRSPARYHPGEMYPRVVGNLDKMGGFANKSFFML